MKRLKVKFVISLPITALICTAMALPGAGWSQASNTWNSNTISPNKTAQEQQNPPKYYVEPAPQRPMARTQSSPNTSSNSRYAPSNLGEILSSGRPTRPSAQQQNTPTLQGDRVTNNTSFNTPPINHTNSPYSTATGPRAMYGQVPQNGYGSRNNNNGMFNSFPGGFSNYFPGGFNGGPFNNNSNSNFSPFGFW